MTPTLDFPLTSTLSGKVRPGSYSLLDEFSGESTDGVYLSRVPVPTILTAVTVVCL